MFEDISVELIDSMGDDLRIANAARVSMGKWKESFDDKDQRLIHYLADHNLWTPFAHCMVSLRETVPIFVARQRFKHMVGFVYNEVSRRYVDTPPTFYKPSEWRQRADNVKQGSSDETVERLEFGEHIVWDDISSPYLSLPTDEAYQGVIDYAVNIYNLMLENDVAPEMARLVLPQSMMTSYIVTGSLYAWARAYLLRKDPHAQKEIQELASHWNDIIQPIFPHAWKELTNA